MANRIVIAGRRIGPGEPAYVVAEMSANHGGSYHRAVKILHAAHKAGADAVKLQTYTADSITLKSDAPPFRVGRGTLWAGRTLHDLYREASMPWAWQPRLRRVADRLGLALFSSPFDAAAVDFLERMEVPAYKIASFELVDLPLIRRVARTRRPLILSTGMATLPEIAEAVAAARGAGATELALLKCTSAYPAPPEEVNLRGIPRLASRFRVPVGLSDHTRGTAVPIAAVTLGACLVEKHFALSRQIHTPDSDFSLEPGEFRSMVDGIRTAEKALGTARFGTSPEERKSRQFRRSLFVVRDVRAGQRFTAANVRSIRPGNGLHPRYLEAVLAGRAACDVARGTPLAWSLVARAPRGREAPPRRSR